MAGKRRRQYGSGSIYRHKGRAGWRGHVVIDGKRHYASGATRGEVADALAELQRKADEAPEHDDDAPTVGEWLTRWADELAPDCAPATDYQRRWAIGRLEPLHELALDELRPRHVSDTLAGLARSGLGARSCERVRVVLGQALTEAQRDELVTGNVAKLARKPKAKAGRTRRTLTPEQAATLLEVAATDRAGILVQLGLLVGLRPGEVTGLRWSDVDLEAGTLTVAQQRRRGPDNALSMSDPKANSGRTVELRPEAVAALRAHKARQATDRLARGRGRTGLVVATANGGPIDPANHRREVARIARNAGVFLRPALTPNELRHSYASLGRAAGVPAYVLYRSMGHVDGRMLDRVYTHDTAPVVPVAAAWAVTVAGHVG